MNRRVRAHLRIGISILLALAMLAMLATGITPSWLWVILTLVLVANIIWSVWDWSPR